jgi:hypothetical protein
VKQDENGVMLGFVTFGLRIIAQHITRVECVMAIQHTSEVECSMVVVVNLGFGFGVWFVFIWTVQCHYNEVE